MNLGRTAPTHLSGRVLAGVPSGRDKFLSRTRARAKNIKFFSIPVNLMVAEPTEFRIATKGEFSRDSGIDGEYGDVIRLSITAATINRTNYEHHANNNITIISTSL